MRVVLVACCGAKLAGTHPAGELYQSELFRKARAYAERHGDAWAILSAEHGLVLPSTPIAAYDRTLTRMTASERRFWSRIVAGQIREHFAGAELVVLAGELYCGWIDRSFTVDRPMRGLGIGRQLQFLKQATR